MRLAPPFVLVVAVLALIGCREEEQDRVVDYQPGVYQGGAMAVLDDQTRDELRQRLDAQDF